MAQMNLSTKQKLTHRFVVAKEKGGQEKVGLGVWN